MDEEDMAQAWRIMTGQDKISISKFWTLKSEVKDRGRAPRPRAGYLEVVETNPIKDCRK